jgi:outer membrane protein assembly factor BamA
MSTFQSLGSLFLGVLLYSFPWIVSAAEPETPPVKVVNRIDEGPTVPIFDVRFDGNHFVGAARLKTKLTGARPGGSLLIPLPPSYDLRVVEADIAKLEEYYRAFGFLDVHVAREVVFDKDFRTARLVFHVVEGARYQAGGVSER